MRVSALEKNLAGNRECWGNTRILGPGHLPIAGCTYVQYMF